MKQHMEAMAQLKQEGREPGLLPDFLDSLPGESSPRSECTSKEKSRRKMAKASRKQNRKPKKKKRK